MSLVCRYRSEEVRRIRPPCLWLQDQEYGLGESQSLPPSQEPSQDYGFSQSQGYGLGGMGYSSQFDVEGGVAETSVVLERDVDYGAWLRESPDLPDEKSVNEEKEVEEQVDMELA